MEEVVRVCLADDDTVGLMLGTAAAIHVPSLCFTLKKQDGASIVGTHGPLGRISSHTHNI